MPGMWTAASDRDYYGDDAEQERAYYEGDSDDPLDAFSADDWSLFATEPEDVRA